MTLEADCTDEAMQKMTFFSSPYPANQGNNLEKTSCDEAHLKLTRKSLTSHKKT